MQDPRTILVIEDDPEIRRILRTGLSADGYSILEADSAATAREQLSQTGIRLITLDIGLGEDDGLELARELRSRVNVPIIIITGRSAPIDRVRGLEHGADDYVAKPFHIREIVLRIRTLLDRYSDGDTQRPTTPDAYTFDHAVLDMRKRELRRLGESTPIDLTETEIRLLELFLRHPARVLSRDEINRYLRGHEWSPLDRTLDGHIARLRRKIEPLADEPHLIKSVRGVGYVFCG